MKLKIFSFYLFILILTSGLVNAQDNLDIDRYIQFQDALISIPIRVNGAVASDITANITISDPDKLIIVSFAQMIYNSTNEEHQYILTDTDKNGIYSYTITATNGELNSTVKNIMEINPTGRIQTSIFQNPILLIFGLASIIFLIFGLYMNNPYLGFISGTLFMLLGVYTMIYGFNNSTDLYTRGMATTLLGVGLFFTIVSAYEWAIGDDDD